MIYVREPTPDEYLDLKQMTRQAIGRVSQRAQIVLLSAQHRSVPEIATIFDLHSASVRKWIRRFNAAGPSGLLDDPRTGRPRQTLLFSATLPASVTRVARSAVLRPVHITVGDLSAPLPLGLTQHVLFVHTQHKQVLCH